MIVTVTLNAAVDRTLTVPNFQTGHRHRASASLTSAGGKGINVARALKRLDGVIPLLESDLPKGEGWAYSRGFDDLAPKDDVFHIHQVYTAAEADPGHGRNFNGHGNHWRNGQWIALGVLGAVAAAAAANSVDCYYRGGRRYCD